MFSMDETARNFVRASEMAAKSGVDASAIAHASLHDEPEMPHVKPKVEMHAAICRELNNLYERKNADYGDSFGKSFAEYGLAAPCMRLEDKLNRLKSLRKKEAKVKDESIEDTLLDIANYAIMSVIELHLEAQRVTF